MAASATPEQINYLERNVLEASLPNLNGLRCVYNNTNIPDWVQEISTDKILEIQQSAKVISKRGDYERVTVGRKRKTRYIIQLGLGFSIAERDILSGQAPGAGETLPVLNARKIARKVSEAVDSLVFNGNSILQMTGILTGAGQSETCYKPWDSNLGADPYDDVLNATIKLTEETNEFDNKFMAIHPSLWKRCMKKDINGNRYSDQILDLFPGPGSIIQSKAVGSDVLIGDAGEDIAVADVQEDIRMLTFPMTSNEVQDWNVRSKVGVGVHETDAFVKLQGALTPTP